MLRGLRKPGKRWTETDRLLLIAVQAHEDDLCPGCGQPRTYGMDEDAQGRYGVHTATCHACAVRERAEHIDQKAKNPPPGRHRYVLPNPELTYAMHHPIHVPPFHS